MILARDIAIPGGFDNLFRRAARKFLPPFFREAFRNGLQKGTSLLNGLGPSFRWTCLSLPLLARWARKRWSLEGLIQRENSSPSDACRAQFREWYPGDLLGQIRWYGRGGWQSVDEGSHLIALREEDRPEAVGPGTLRVAGRTFFEHCPPDIGRKTIGSAMASLRKGESLLLYAPHEFCFGGTGEFAWVPGWRELYEMARQAGGIRVRDFNPGFDRNGFFHFVVERRPIGQGGDSRAKAFRGVGHYFYMKVGGNRLLGHSNKVLSAVGLRALHRLCPRVFEHSYLDRIPESADIQQDEIAMGHYGPWITTARSRGACVILYGPGDRFRERPEPDYAALQSRGDFRDQYRSSHLVLMQAGGVWRVDSTWTYPGLCRWIDVPSSAAVFPRTKKKIAPAGERVFCFLSLYNEKWKGSQTARKIAERCPDLKFIALGCEPFGLPNCREYPPMDNRSRDFRRIVTQADFIVAPSREDSQPGTVAECGSLGLLPIVSEYAGYVLSFPNRIDVDDLDQCAATLRAAQAAHGGVVKEWQTLHARYIERFHRPERCEELLRFYLGEVYSDFYGRRAPLPLTDAPPMDNFL